MPPQAYQTSQYVVPRGGIFLGKWSSSCLRYEHSVSCRNQYMFKFEALEFIYV
jgi:hypothetical protein